jgi:hypothetical protein
MDINFQKYEAPEFFLYCPCCFLLAYKGSGMGTTPDLPMTNMEQAIERLYDLNVGTVGSGLARHERPHKPVLMLAVLDLIATGQVTPQHIAWSRDLRTRFTEYFDQVHQLNDDNTPAASRGLGRRGPPIGVHTDRSRCHRRTGFCPTDQRF